MTMRFWPEGLDALVVKPTGKHWKVAIDMHVSDRQVWREEFAPSELRWFITWLQGCATEAEKHNEALEASQEKERP
jgi:hypothetical protein